MPQVANLLIPDWSHLQFFEEKDREYKQQQKEQYVTVSAKTSHVRTKI